MTFDLNKIASPIRGLEAMSICLSDTDLLYTLWTRSDGINVGEDVVALFGLMARIRQEVFVAMGIDDAGYSAQMETKTHLILIRHIRNDYMVVFVFNSQIAAGLANIQVTHVVEQLDALLPASLNGSTEHPWGLTKAHPSTDITIQDTIFADKPKRTVTPNPSRPILSDEDIPISTLTPNDRRIHHEDFRVTAETPLYFEGSTFSDEEHSRAVSIVHYVTQVLGDTPNVYTRLAINANLSIASIRDPNTLTTEQVQRLEAAAIKILNVTHIPT